MKTGTAETVNEINQSSELSENNDEICENDDEIGETINALSDEIGGDDVVEISNTDSIFNINDIGNVVRREISEVLEDDQKYQLIKNVWVPDSNYIFPASGKRNLRFQINWINKFKFFFVNIAFFFVTTL